MDEGDAMKVQGRLLVTDAALAVGDAQAPDGSAFRVLAIHAPDGSLAIEVPLTLEGAATLAAALEGRQVVRASALIGADGRAVKL